MRPPYILAIGAMLGRLRTSKEYGEIFLMYAGTISSDEC